MPRPRFQDDLTESILISVHALVASYVDDNAGRPDHDVLKPLIAYAAGKPHRKRRIANLIAALTGRNVTRDMVRLWLHRDEAKRREPSFNYGLLLIAVIQDLRKREADKNGKKENHEHSNNDQ